MFGDGPGLCVYVLAGYTGTYISHGDKAHKLTPVHHLSWF